jgi:predicted nucleotide-binding protein
MIESSFETKNNFFTTKFKQSGRNQNKTYQIYFQAYNAFKEEIRIKCYVLESDLKTIDACNFFKLEYKDEALRTNLSMMQKASLLVEKLYQLGDNDNHLAKMLLVGNGVALKTPSEAIEIAKFLESHGLISISHYANQTDLYVCITTAGKINYEEQTTQSSTSTMQQEKGDLSKISNIFIVHGHNNEMKETVARVVMKLGYNPIILHEMPNQGRTIIEKFTDHSDEVQYAIVLLSADDFAYSKNSPPDKAKLRPRQNVVFELGYFIGKMGRKNVFPLYETMENFELHSDFGGVALVEFDKNGGWKSALGKELEALGVTIDWSSLMK